MSNLFVLGNGESRKHIPVDMLKYSGKVWGCNAMYREHQLDGLIAVDPMLQHEIYRSGYAHENPTYFRSWDWMPAEHYDMMKEAQCSNLKDPNIREWKANPEGHYLSFVIHGQSAVHQNRITDRWKGDGFENVYITWLYGNDKITQLKDIMNDLYGGAWEGDEIGPEDPGWCSGATAMYIACKVEKPKTCYLLGMDMYSTTDYVNNLYKDTVGYVSKDESALTPNNWVIQKAKCMMRYPDIQFIKVNPMETNRISTAIPEWESVPNISYINMKEFEKKFNLELDF